MIYPDIRVQLPDMGGYINARGDVKYLYVYVGDRQITKSTGKTKGLSPNALVELSMMTRISQCSCLILSTMILWDYPSHLWL